MISGFRCEVDDKSALLVCDAASGGNSLLSFQETYLALADGTDCPKTSVRNYHYSQRNSPEQRSSLMLIQTNNIHKTAKQAVLDKIRIWFLNIPHRLVF
jgi:hypothetical protein